VAQGRRYTLLAMTLPPTPTYPVFNGGGTPTPESGTLVLLGTGLGGLGLWRKGLAG